MGWLATRGWERGKGAEVGWEVKRPGPKFSTITSGWLAVIEFLLATTSQFAIKPAAPAPRAPARHEFDSSFKEEMFLVSLPFLQFRRKTARSSTNAKLPGRLR